MPPSERVSSPTLRAARASRSSGCGWSTSTPHPDGYRYSQFCRHYERWVRTLDPTMRQVHRAGEKVFVDFSGKRPVLVRSDDRRARPRRALRRRRSAPRSYMYAEACLSQDLPSWISAHVRMLEFFQGSPAILVPDNLRSGVTQAVPLRAGDQPHVPRVRPALRDRGRARPGVAAPGIRRVVEAAVLVAQRWILAALRHRRFFQPRRAERGDLRAPAPRSTTAR